MIVLSVASFLVCMGAAFAAGAAIGIKLYKKRRRNHD